MEQGKAFEIPKALVWKSYQQVRKNKGAAGSDGQTLKGFIKNRDRNLYKIWNRLSSGSYFPPPVLEKKIPKPDGKERVLGIPTVGDRVAQGAVKIYLEELLEPHFDQDSYGYRPNKSAHQALEVCKERSWKHSWVLELDIQGFFDCVRHDLVLEALKYHKVPKWVLLYCQRWLEAPSVEEVGQQTAAVRALGTPQGGVISPLLANLFLHYAFDYWMRRKRPHVPFERYADDIVCHCNRMKDAEALKKDLEERMGEVGLTLHPKKTQVVYVGSFERNNVETSFTFLGYDFQQRVVRSRKGELIRVCMPGASKKALKGIAEMIRSWKIPREISEEIEELADRYRGTVRGWINYYGRHWNRIFSYRLWTNFENRLIGWMKAKYNLGAKAAVKRLNRIRKEKPKLFPHWYLLCAKANA